MIEETIDFMKDYWLHTAVGVGLLGILGLSGWKHLQEYRRQQHETDERYKDTFFEDLRNLCLGTTEEYESRRGSK